MSIQETHQWAKEKMGKWFGAVKDKTQTELSRVNKVTSPQNLQFSNKSFFGDVTSRDGDLFFHFFPSDDSNFNLCVENPNSGTHWVFSHSFVDALTEAFLSVFKHEDRLFLDFVSELNSYVVRCAGFGDNPLQDDMIERTLLKIKEKYEK